MVKNLRTYRLAVEFYNACLKIKIPGYLRNQLLRASSSIVLNLSEGYGQKTAANKKRFYYIALGSVRECQSVFDLIVPSFAAVDMADHLGGCLYKLIQRT